MPIKKNHAEDELIENMLNTETNGEVDDDHEDIAGSTMHKMNYTPQSIGIYLGMRGSFNI